MTLPTLPQVFIDTTYAPPAGQTIVVPNGGDFQAALNAANLGDTITLQAGATYTGPFTLPNKTTGAGWIYIQSSALASLPTPGNRVFPVQAVSMPKIVGNPAIQTATGAHHYRLIGLEIVPAIGGTVINTVIFGTGSETSVAALPHHITVDRCYIHGNVSPTQEAYTGINMSSASTAAIDSYISGFRATTQDAQAITSTNGPGPFKIDNCYLEATGESILFGGGDPHIANQIPSDIEIVGNYMFKPLSWRVGDPAYAGVNWRVKNLFELKNAQRVLIDGNIMDNNWIQADQQGWALNFTPRNQGNNAPWSAVRDVTFTRNMIRHSTAGMLLAGYDTTFPSQQMQRLLIQNNVFVDIGAYPSGPRVGWFFDIVNGPTDVTIDHNTVFKTALVFYAEAGTIQLTAVRFVFTNNNMDNNVGGIGGDNVATPAAVLSTYFPGAVFTKNDLWHATASDYPAGNLVSAASFVNFAAGDYHLAPGDPGIAAGTDGKDIGADITAVNLATLHAIDGLDPVIPTVFAFADTQMPQFRVRTRQVIF